MSSGKGSGILPTTGKTRGFSWSKGTAGCHGAQSAGGKTGGMVVRWRACLTGDISFRMGVEGENEGEGCQSPQALRTPFRAKEKDLEKGTATKMRQCVLRPGPQEKGWNRAGVKQSRSWSLKGKESGAKGKGGVGGGIPKGRNVKVVSQE